MAWERPVFDHCEAWRNASKSETLDGDLAPLLDLLWDLGLWGVGSGGQHHLALYWPAVELCKSVVMCTWPGSWLQRMDPYTCPCAGNTARIIIPIL